MEAKKHTEGTDIFEVFEYETVKDRAGVNVEVVDKSSIRQYSLVQINNQIVNLQTELTKLQNIKTKIDTINK